VGRHPDGRQKAVQIGMNIDMQAGRQKAVQIDRYPLKQAGIPSTGRHTESMVNRLLNK